MRAILIKELPACIYVNTSPVKYKYAAAVTWPDGPSRHKHQIRLTLVHFDRAGLGFTHFNRSGVCCYLCRKRNRFQLSLHALWSLE